MSSFSKILSVLGFILILGTKGFSQTQVNTNSSQSTSVNNQGDTGQLKSEHNKTDSKTNHCDNASVEKEIIKNLVTPFPSDSTLKNSIPQVYVSDNFFEKKNDLKEINLKE